MQQQNFLETELLDIIFRDKNKQYGAYELRKQYPVRARQALGYLVLGLILTAATYHFMPAPDIPTVIQLPVAPTEGIQPLGPDLEIICTGGGFTNSKPPTESATFQIVETKTQKPNDEPEEEDEQDDTSELDRDATEGPQTDEPVGDGPAGGETDLVPGGSPDGDIGATAANPDPTPAPPAPKPKEFEDYAEEMPEYPGGENAMMQYLRDRIRYPKMASDNDVQGTVYVSFVVSRSGKVTRVKVKKGIGMGCDREAVRVIKTMPAWKPGMNGGNKVNVSYVIPVLFEL